MKRVGNLYSNICSIDNLLLADKLASKGKSKQLGVLTHRKNCKANILKLQQMLTNKNFKTSPYKTFVIKEPKEREIFCLPYFPDRIAHHAIMNVLKPVFNKTFTADTYSSIEGKGTHSASYALRRALRDQDAATYCLKLDIRKFYPSIDHSILKNLLRRKFKDNDLLELLDEIIDSADGVPIGNYLSQYFANYYLSGFDHWLKECKRIKYYFRYKDDLVILSDNKDQLHSLLFDIKEYLRQKLNLTVKGNYQVFAVKDRGIDFVGYVHYHTHVLMRKSIKKAFARKIYNGAGHQTIAAYLGWAKHCNSNNLLNKLLHVQIQRTEYRTTCTKRIRGRQNKNRAHSEQRGHNTQMGSKAIRLYKGMSLHADRIQEPKICNVDGQQIFT